MSTGSDFQRGMAVAFVFALLGSACAARPRPDTKIASTQASADAGTTDEGDEGDEADDEVAKEDAAETAQDFDAPNGPCPADMALVESFCIDKYEASLVEMRADGTEQPFAHYLPVDGHDVRAVSAPHVFPQGYISEVQAQEACNASGKRLCKPEEWKTACMGPSHTTFPYGDARRPGACHDTGKSAVVAVFGAKAVAASTPYAPPPRDPATAPPGAARGKTGGKQAHMTKGRAAQTTRPRASLAKNASKPATGKPLVAKKSARRPAKSSARPASVDPGVWARLNDPALGKFEGGLARTGEHAECVNTFGVFDMVGNLHEWVATDPSTPHGTFAGGYYLDTTINGDGCLYRTQAHAHDYHDYSTGFRCCGDAHEITEHDLRSTR
jgi:formylglycine-generating enzyme required for sulfatase activity